MSEIKKIEQIQERYIKYVLGTTSKYIALEEVKKAKLRLEVGKGVMKFEENILHPTV